MKYNQELPKEVEAKLDTYIERVKAIKWFHPSPDLKQEDISKQVTVALEAFGIKASVEYRKLQTPNDWGAAWGAARCAARDAAWGAARDAARDAAWGAVDLLSSDFDAYSKKYPKGSFLNLIPLWEAGLYPVGVVDGKFIVYVPASKQEFPEDWLK